MPRYDGAAGVSRPPYSCGQLLPICGPDFRPVYLCSLYLGKHGIHGNHNVCSRKQFPSLTQDSYPKSATRWEPTHLVQKLRITRWRCALGDIRL